MKRANWWEQVPDRYVPIPGTRIRRESENDMAAVEYISDGEPLSGGTYFNYFIDKTQNHRKVGDIISTYDELLDLHHGTVLGVRDGRYGLWDGNRRIILFASSFNPNPESYLPVTITALPPIT